jgi:membrane protein required for colicin V production
VNVVDVAILAVIGLFAVGGMRRGFLLGLIDLVAFGLSVVVAARLAGAVAEPLRERGIPAELAAGAGFVIVGVLSLAFLGFAARVILAPLGAMNTGSPLSWANGVLGLLPGAIRGFAVAALLVLLLNALPPELGLRGSLREARLAQPIADTGLRALDTGLGWAGIDLRALGMPFAGSTSEPAAAP